jgi:hypothetical protein
MVTSKILLPSHADRQIEHADADVTHDPAPSADLSSGDPGRRDQVEELLGYLKSGNKSNPHSLPIAERAPEISTQLIVLEHLFQAAREKGSGAVPMYGDADWDAFWFGLERIVRHVRLLAEDMYAQGRLENS